MNADCEAAARQMAAIVAQLLALAAIAERACLAPVAERLRLLSILLPAEAAAWAFVFGQPPQAFDACGDDGRAGAEALAARLRLLALVLTETAGLMAASPLDRPFRFSPIAGAPAAARSRGPLLPGPRAFDTS